MGPYSQSRKKKLNWIDSLAIVSGRVNCPTSASQRQKRRNNHEARVADFPTNSLTHD